MILSSNIQEIPTYKCYSCTVYFFFSTSIPILYSSFFQRIIIDNGYYFRTISICVLSYAQFCLHSEINPLDQVMIECWILALSQRHLCMGLIHVSNGRLSFTIPVNDIWPITVAQQHVS